MRIMYFLLVLAVSASAQDFKMGKVSKAELEQKQHPSDTSAAAAVLYKKTDTYFTVNREGFYNVVTDAEVRIKIYKKEGYKFADFEKVYYAGSHSDRLVFSNDASYNLVDGKIVKTKLKSESEFHEKKDKNYKSKKISFPNVKEGTIIEYKYSHTTYNVTKLQDFYFQEEIPVNHAYFRFTAPENYEYSRILTGYRTPERNDERFNDGGSAINNYRVTFIMNDVPALKDEDFVNNINNYRSSIKHELIAKMNAGAITENYAMDWGAVAKQIFDNDDFGKELDRKNYFEEDINALLIGIVGNDNKIKAIFDHVQNRMTWNEYHGYSCDQGVKSAYNSRTGNVAEINLMLTAMLKHAGINANPVLVSTRANGIAQFPSRTAFNYVIVGVQNEDNLTLLDATSKYSQPNIVPRRVLNWKGRMIRADGSSQEVELMPKTISKERINVVAIINPEGLVRGEIKDLYQDYNAYNFRENYLALNTESYVQKLEARYKGLEVEKYERSTDAELTKSLEEKFTFAHNNITEIIGERMYFSPMLLYKLDNNPFKQETRQYPVDFGFPNQDQYNFTITIPDGYKIESIPQPISISMGQNIGSFTYDVIENGNKIQLSTTYDINLPIVESANYGVLKEFYRKMIAKQNEKIVLRKI